MKVTEKDVAYVAELANLELTEEERTGMLRDLNSILDYIDRLNELDTSDVPPMAQVSDRYGVDKSKQGSDRFAYASREEFSKDCESRCRMMKRWQCARRGRRFLQGTESDREIVHKIFQSLMD